MRLFRFVGEKEYNDIMSGVIRHNDRDWSEYNDTNSKGICFFANNRTDNIDRIVETALDDWGFSGIVKEYAIFEIDVPTARRAYGWYSGGKRTEYNLTEYSKANVVKAYRIHGKYWHRTIEQTF